MALREYRCLNCGKITEKLYWTDYPREITCECGKKAHYIFSAPGAVWVNWRPGYDVGLDRYFSSKRERDNYLAENNLSEARSDSGHESASMPEEKNHKLAYLAAKEAKLKRDV